MSRRLLWEDDVIKVIDNHTNDDNTLRIQNLRE